MGCAGFHFLIRYCVVNPAWMVEVFYLRFLRWNYDAGCLLRAASVFLVLDFLMFCFGGGGGSGSVELEIYT